MNTYTSLLGWALAGASTVTALPQTIHLLRSKSSKGVHVGTPAIAIVTMFSWCLYTETIHDMPALFSSIGPLIAWGVSLLALLFLRAPKALRALLTATLATLVLSIAWYNDLLPTGFFGAIAATGSCIWALPQLIKLTRRPGRDLTGVSSLAYTALGIENAAWIIYAALTLTPAYAIAPIVQLPACLIIASHSRRFKSRQRSKALHPSIGKTIKTKVAAELHLDKIKGDPQAMPNKIPVMVAVGDKIH